MAKKFRRTKEEIKLGLSAEEALERREAAKKKPAKTAKKKSPVKGTAKSPKKVKEEPETDEIKMTEASSNRLIKKLAGTHEIKPRELKKNIEATIEQKLTEFLGVLMNGVEYRAVNHRDHDLKNLLEKLEKEKWIFAFNMLDGSLTNYHVYMRIKQ